ncbi:hypothetical protein C8J57DRAFT_1288277 [Mycena rebaudengoi]|nr:hypothetical protein C8J57DRAFT_1288277 [Mycena rebaudengoi]
MAVRPEISLEAFRSSRAGEVSEPDVLSAQLDVSPGARDAVAARVEAAKKKLFTDPQSPEQLLHAFTTFSDEVWRDTKRILNLDGVPGISRSFRWCLCAYSILLAPWSVVALKVTHMGSTKELGFAVHASQPLKAGEIIYELAGLLSTDTEAPNFTRLAEMEADDGTPRVLIGPIRLVNHDCSPNAEYMFIPGHPLARTIRVLRDIAAGDEVSLLRRQLFRGPQPRLPMPDVQGGAQPEDRAPWAVP